MDVDSGPVIPVLNISPGASGMAFIGAGSFGDDKYLAALAVTLDFLRISIAPGGAAEVLREQPGGRCGVVICNGAGTALGKSGRRQKVNEVMPAKGSGVGRGILFHPIFFNARTRAGRLVPSGALAGLREYTTFLSGTAANPEAGLRWSSFLGMVLYRVVSGVCGGGTNINPGGGTAGGRKSG